MPSEILPSGSGLTWTAALPYLAAIGTAALGYLGARFTARAQLEKTLFDASRDWVAQAQEQLARSSARILELEERCRVAEAEVIRMRGEVNGSLQREDSLRRFIKRKGITPPPRLTRLRDPNGEGSDDHDPDDG